MRRGRPKPLPATTPAERAPTPSASGAAAGAARGGTGGLSARPATGRPVFPAEALILLVKAPVPGMVKTRFMPSLDAGQAAAVYAALVEDLVAGLMDGLGSISIFYTPDDAGPDIRRWLGPAPRLHPQGNGDLGARMDAAFRVAFRGGASRVILAGSDVPGLEPGIVLRAFHELTGCPVVLAPSRDGGYSLIGLDAPRPDLFAGVEWSTGLVLAQTLSLSSARGLPVALLETLDDLDTFADLERLWHSLARRGHAERDQARGPRHPRTTAMLEAIFDGTAHSPPAPHGEAGTP
jgi:uncharacterized protein